MRVHAQRRMAELAGQPGKPVHRDQVHQVHQQHPEKHRERQRGDEVVLGAERAAHVLIDELDHPFHEILQSARRAGRHVAGGPVKHEQEDRAKQERPQQAVHMDRPETHLRHLFRVVRKAPVTVRVLAEGPVGQVVLDIFGGSDCASHASGCFLDERIRLD